MCATRVHAYMCTSLSLLFIQPRIDGDTLNQVEKGGASPKPSVPAKSIFRTGRQTLTVHKHDVVCEDRDQVSGKHFTSLDTTLSLMK